jgi:hypothetical protein
MRDYPQDGYFECEEALDCPDTVFIDELDTVIKFDCTGTFSVTFYLLPFTCYLLPVAQPS